jgi:hypothetical protein
VERVGGRAAVRRRLGQGADDFEELDDRAGPPVRDDERQGIVTSQPPRIEEAGLTAYQEDIQTLRAMSERATRRRKERGVA